MTTIFVVLGIVYHRDTVKEASKHGTYLAHLIIAGDGGMRAVAEDVHDLGHGAARVRRGGCDRVVVLCVRGAPAGPRAVSAPAHRMRRPVLRHFAPVVHVHQPRVLEHKQIIISTRRK